MSEEFKPHEVEDTYQAVLTKGEAFIIQEIRKLNFGSLRVHVSGGRITRLETINSELMEEKKDSDVVEFDTIPEQK